MTDQAREKQYGNARFINTWTILILSGLVIEFVARLLGYDENPLDFYHPLIPAFTGISAALLVLAGYFMLMSEKAKQSSLYRRNGAMVVITGVLMLGAFFLFKEIVSMIF